MKRISGWRPLLPIFALVSISCAAWAAQKGFKLVMDGSILSGDVQVIQGRPYVPLSDMARILDRTIVKQDGAFGLLQTAGVRPGERLPGKISSDLYSGMWRLRVEKVEKVASYTPLYGSDKAPITPKEAGDVLAIVTCRLKNGTPAMQEVSFDKNASGNTALIDEEEHGYVPLGFDIRSSGYSWSARMPPGTVVDFVILFSIPNGANLTRLNYSVGGSGMERFTDFQVSLRP